METIKATANQSKRTFTIRKYTNNNIVVKYRTIQFNKQEFERCERHTHKDWKQFLHGSNHYTVKYYF